MISRQHQGSRVIKILKSSILAISLIFAGSAYSLEIGEKAPDVKLPVISQEGYLSLEDLRGKVVYVDFWASWCAPCRKSLPKLNALREELKHRGLEIYAINLDESLDDALAFLKEIPVDYPVVWDKSGKSAELFQITGMPTAYLIDRDGTVRWMHQGFGFGSRQQDAVDRKIKKLLNIYEP